MQKTDTRLLVRQAWMELYQATGRAPNDAAVKEWLVKREGVSRNSTTVSQELQTIRRDAEQAYFETTMLPGLKLGLPTELALAASQFLAELLKAGRSEAASRVAEAQSEVRRAAIEIEALEERLKDRDKQLERRSAELAALRERIAKEAAASSSIEGVVRKRPAQQGRK